MRIQLIRDSDDGECTLGRMYCEGDFMCYTIERPWKNNKRRVSCIPEGTYPLTTKEYGRFWDKYNKPIPILEDTDPRSEILIHPANYAKDLAGCIALGDSKGEQAVWNSVKTWKKWLPVISVCTEIWIHKQIK